VRRWFENDEQVKGLMLFNIEGEELFFLHRKGAQLLATDFSRNHRAHLFFNQSLTVAENQVLVTLVDRKSDPFHRTGDEEYELIMSTPVVQTKYGTVGVMLMRIDMSEFLENFKDSYWVTGDGNYVRGCNLSLDENAASLDKSNDDCNAFEEFPELQLAETSDPLILSGNNNSSFGLGLMCCNSGTIPQ
jgi:hypothetical protein